MGGRDPEFSGIKVEHGDKVVGGSEPSSLPFDCREDAVEGFEERVGCFVGSSLFSVGGGGKEEA